MRDDETIERAISEHGDVVWRVCRMRLGQRADAQDAFQETFLAYATHDEVPFADANHERAWLIRVATNACIDLLRSPTHTMANLDDAFVEIPTDEPADDPGSALWEVSDALATLPAEQRQALYLTVGEGYPATEVAEMMGAPANTVYSWVARAKQKLREVLG